MILKPNVVYALCGNEKIKFGAVEGLFTFNSENIETESDEDSEFLLAEGSTTRNKGSVAGANVSDDVSMISPTPQVSTKFAPGFGKENNNLNSDFIPETPVSNCSSYKCGSKKILVLESPTSQSTPSAVPSKSTLDGFTSPAFFSPISDKGLFTPVRAKESYCNDPGIEKESLRNEKIESLKSDESNDSTDVEDFFRDDLIDKVNCPQNDSNVKEDLYTKSTQAFCQMAVPSYSVSESDNTQDILSAFEHDDKIKNVENSNDHTQDILNAFEEPTQNVPLANVSKSDIQAFDKADCGTPFRKPMSTPFRTKRQKDLRPSSYNSPTRTDIFDVPTQVFDRIPFKSDINAKSKDSDAYNEKEEDDIFNMPTQCFSYDDIRATKEDEGSSPKDISKLPTQVFDVPTQVLDEPTQVSDSSIYKSNRDEGTKSKKNISLLLESEMVNSSENIQSESHKIKSHNISPDTSDGEAVQVFDGCNFGRVTPVCDENLNCDVTEEAQNPSLAERDPAINENKKTELIDANTDSNSSETILRGEEYIEESIEPTQIFSRSQLIGNEDEGMKSNKNKSLLMETVIPFKSDINAKSKDNDAYNKKEEDDIFNMPTQCFSYDDIRATKEDEGSSPKDISKLPTQVFDVPTQVLDEPTQVSDSSIYKSNRDEGTKSKKNKSLLLESEMVNSSENVQSESKKIKSHNISPDSSDNEATQIFDGCNFGRVTTPISDENLKCDAIRKTQNLPLAENDTALNETKRTELNDMDTDSNSSETILRGEEYIEESIEPTQIFSRSQFIGNEEEGMKSNKNKSLLMETAMSNSSENVQSESHKISPDSSDNEATQIFDGCNFGRVTPVCDEDLKCDAKIKTQNLPLAENDTALNKTKRTELNDMDTDSNSSETILRGEEYLEESIEPTQIFSRSQFIGNEEEGMKSNKNKSLLMETAMSNSSENVQPESHKISPDSSDNEATQIFDGCNFGRVTTPVCDEDLKCDATRKTQNLPLAENDTALNETKRTELNDMDTDSNSSETILRGEEYLEESIEPTQIFSRSQFIGNEEEGMKSNKNKSLLMETAMSNSSENVQSESHKISPDSYDNEATQIFDGCNFGRVTPVCDEDLKCDATRKTQNLLLAENDTALNGIKRTELNDEDTDSNCSETILKDDEYIEEPIEPTQIFSRSQIIDNKDSIKNKNKTFGTNETLKQSTKTNDDETIFQGKNEERTIEISGNNDANANDKDRETAVDNEHAEITDQDKDSCASEIILKDKDDNTTNGSVEDKDEENEIIIDNLESKNKYETEKEDDEIAIDDKNSEKNEKDDEITIEDFEDNAEILDEEEDIESCASETLLQDLNSDAEMETKSCNGTYKEKNSRITDHKNKEPLAFSTPLQNANADSLQKVKEDASKDDSGILKLELTGDSVSLSSNILKDFDEKNMISKQNNEIKKNASENEKEVEINLNIECHQKNKCLIIPSEDLTKESKISVRVEKPSFASSVEMKDSQFNDHEKMGKNLQSDLNTQASDFDTPEFSYSCFEIPTDFLVNSSSKLSYKSPKTKISSVDSPISPNTGSKSQALFNLSSGEEENDSDHSSITCLSDSSERKRITSETKTCESRSSGRLQKKKLNFDRVFSDSESPPKKIKLQVQSKSRYSKRSLKNNSTISDSVDLTHEKSCQDSSEKKGSTSKTCESRSFGQFQKNKLNFDGIFSDSESPSKDLKLEKYLKNSSSISDSVDLSLEKDCNAEKLEPMQPSKRKARRGKVENTLRATSSKNKAKAQIKRSSQANCTTPLSIAKTETENVESSHVNLNYLKKSEVKLINIITSKNTTENSTDLKGTRLSDNSLKYISSHMDNNISLKDQKSNRKSLEKSQTPNKNSENTKIKPVRQTRHGRRNTAPKRYSPSKPHTTISTNKGKKLENLEDADKSELINCKEIEDKVMLENEDGKMLGKITAGKISTNKKSGKFVKSCKPKSNQKQEDSESSKMSSNYSESDNIEKRSTIKTRTKYRNELSQDCKVNCDETAVCNISTRHSGNQMPAMIPEGITVCSTSRLEDFESNKVCLTVEPQNSGAKKDNSQTHLVLPLKDQEERSSLNLQKDEADGNFRGNANQSKRKKGTELDKNSTKDKVIEGSLSENEEKENTKLSKRTRSNAAKNIIPEEDRPKRMTRNSSLPSQINKTIYHSEPRGQESVQKDSLPIDDSTCSYSSINGKTELQKTVTRTKKSNKKLYEESSNQEHNFVKQSGNNANSKGNVLSTKVQNDISTEMPLIERKTRYKRSIQHNVLPIQINKINYKTRRSENLEAKNNLSKEPNYSSSALVSGTEDSEKKHETLNESNEKTPENSNFVTRNPQVNLTEDVSGESYSQIKLNDSKDKKLSRKTRHNVLEKPIMEENIKPRRNTRHNNSKIKFDEKEIVTKKPLYHESETDLDPSLSISSATTETEEENMVKKKFTRRTRGTSSSKTESSSVVSSTNLRSRGRKGFMENEMEVSYISENSSSSTLQESCAISNTRGKRKTSVKTLSPKRIRSTKSSCKSSPSFLKEEVLWSSAERQSMASKQPRVLFTTFKDINEELLVKNLGGKIADCASDCSVLVTNTIKRTCKLLACIGKGVPVVSLEWLTASKRARNFVDPWQYLVSDTEAENKFVFNLRSSLETATKCKLLLGYSIYVTDSVKPPPEEMREIVECAGGDYLDMPPKVSSSKIVVVTCNQDKKVWNPLKKLKLSLVSTEFILTGLLRQQIMINEYTVC